MSRILGLFCDFKILRCAECSAPPPVLAHNMKGCELYTFVCKENAVSNLLYLNHRLLCNVRENEVVVTKQVALRHASLEHTFSQNYMPQLVAWTTGPVFSDFALYLRAHSVPAWHLSFLFVAGAHGALWLNLCMHDIYEFVITKTSGTRGEERGKPECWCAQQPSQHPTEERRGTEPLSCQA